MSLPRQIASFLLAGEPCLACGHPAARLVIYADNRTVWHTNGAQVCYLLNPPVEKQAVKP